MQGRGVSIAALAACTLAGTAWAQEPAAHGDARHGQAISYSCLGCHGIEGYKNAYPMYSVPKLEGQNPDYLAVALHGYRDGDRAHVTMHSQAATLSDQDIAISPLTSPASRSCPRARLRAACRRRRRYASRATARTASPSRRCTPRSRVSTRTTWCARSMSTARAAARTRS